MRIEINFPLTIFCVEKWFKKFFFFAIRGASYTFNMCMFIVAQEFIIKMQHISLK